MNRLTLTALTIMFMTPIVVFGVTGYMLFDDAITAEQTNNKIEYLNGCYDSAYDAYADTWDAECAIVGKQPDCILEDSRAADLDMYYTQLRDNCVQTFKAL